MKRVLNNIRKLLINRRTRRLRTRLVSIVAAVVVFVTTYGLVMPAITMESEAYCGIEAHEHTDDCYEDQLICSIPESPGHQHDESCYTTRQELTCTVEDHTHGDTCYDGEGNIICETPEHVHDGACFEDVSELTCTLEESEGHQHDAVCYEKVLVCERPVHTHSVECYQDPDQLMVESADVAVTVEGGGGTGTTDTLIDSDNAAWGEEPGAEGDPDDMWDDGSGDAAEEDFSEDSVEAAPGDPLEDPADSSPDVNASVEDPADAADDQTNSSVDAAGNGTGAVEETEENAEDRTADAPAYDITETLNGNDENNNSVDLSGEEAGAAGTTADPAQGGGEDLEEDRYVPPLEPLNFAAILNSRTTIYHYPVAEGETVEDSSQISGWKKVEKNTELGPNDLLRVYLSYTIPAGSLNETNPTAVYRLPANLHLTDAQVEAINAIENGIAASYIDYSTLTVTDPGNYHKYLGAEAVEGTRTPDQDAREYLNALASDGKDAQEFISATVRVENVFDTEGTYGEKGACLGQDLIFTFSPYTIEKNQNTYDASGQPTGAGQKVRGWFSLDFNLGQVDFGEPWTEEDVENTETIENADFRQNEVRVREFQTTDVIFVEKDKDLGLEEISAKLRVLLSDETVVSDEINEISEPEDAEEADEAEDADGTDDAEDADEAKATDETDENDGTGREILFFDEDGNPVSKEAGLSDEENSPEVSDQSASDQSGQKDKEDDDTDKDGNNKDKTEKDGQTADKETDKTDKTDPESLMPAMSFEDSIRVSTGKPAGVEDGSAGSAAANAAEALPKKAKVTVRVEADEGTFPVGTTMVLSAVEDMDAVAETVRDAVENAQSESENGSSASENSGSADKNKKSAADSKGSSAGDDQPAATNGNQKTYGFQAVDISFRDKDGKEIEPAKPVRVALTSSIVEQVKKEKEEDANSVIADPIVVHVDDDGNAETMELVAPDEIEPAKGKTEEELLKELEDKADKEKEAGEAEKKEAAENEKEAGEAENKEPAESEKETESAAESATVFFDADSFSVYAIVYTVDFYWEVNGREYQFSLPGGGFISFSDLIEVLGVAETGKKSDDFAGEAGDPGIDNDILDDIAVSKKTREFVADVESVEFSNPGLIDVSIVESKTTVGGIKESRGLGVRYSADLTEEQIEQINGTVVESGDWALISMQPFESEETLTVTMKTGEVFTIRVTDAQIKKTVIDARGDTWEITVTYNDEAEIPEDAELRVREFLPEDEEYEEYYQKSLEKVGVAAVPDTTEDEQASEVNDEDTAAETTSEDNSVSTYAHIFDIQIWADDHEIQPASDVSVSIKLLDAPEEDTDLRVVHFGKDGLEEMELTGDDEETGEKAGGTELNFVTDEFSVYAIVPGPSSNTTYTKVKSVNELTSVANGFYIGHTSGYYLKNTTTTKSNRTYIQKTGQKDTPNVGNSNASNDAARYYFEDAPDGKYYIYCYDSNNAKQYVCNGGNNSISLTTDTSAKTAFTVDVNEFGVFNIHNGNWYLNMSGGSGGNGFASANSSSDSNNSLYIWRNREAAEDPFGLDGMTFGLITWTGGRTAKGLMATENNHTNEETGQPYQGCLEAKFLSVMAREDDAGDKLYVPNDTADTVTQWTFEVVDQNNHYYYLKADNGKYLKITSSGLELVDTPDNSCRIKVTAGTGKNKGQISLKAVGNGNKALTYSGKYAQGYNTSGVSGSEWLYLVTPMSESQLAQYEKVYTATKVSVSDTERVYTGAHVVIYARQWKNDHYEYYAVNSKGELVPCEESGDTIEWYGGNVNDMLWQFTEYLDDSGSPSGYYELQNVYVRDNNIGNQQNNPEYTPEPSYLAPQFSTGTVLFDHTVGLLLQGRTNKQYFTQIVAWDNPDYMYSGLTVDLNQPDPTLEPCYRADGLDFYFAIMDEVPVDDEIHAVGTVDNNQYGITMKMVDLSNGVNTADLTGQMNAFFNNGIQNGKTWEHTPGLLSTNLTNGYPTTMNANSGGSLAGLYSGAVDVNHLFMDSTYRATGYYEYNSAQNFAHLLKSGDALVGQASPDGGTYAVNDFVVYKELGTNDTTSKDTLKHGQFFPYNDIKPGFFASTNPENLYNATGDLLPDSDPRKHEQLYLVEGTTDYYFAMELEASFVQTPNGLDAWGHDIIFEFSGDDDFWLYVDDELVIDLGGIHSAVSGTVNFRTGQVIVNPRSKKHAQNTTLYDLFIANYIARGDDPVTATNKANELFVVNAEGNRVFKDDTNHTMRIFYMERGAGASNLHMKFNLAAVKKGTVELHKELAGVSDTESTFALFPYQIYYTMEDNPATDEDESSPENQKLLRNAFGAREVLLAEGLVTQAQLDADPPGYTEQQLSDMYLTSNYYRIYRAAESTDYVYYKDQTRPVTFLPELTVDGVTYYNVFMLRPDETAVINFPTVAYDPESSQKYTVNEYRIVECGIDSTVYTQVSANDEVLAGEPIASGSNIKDYGIGMDTTNHRPRVKYVNKVATLNNLNITKELYRKLGEQAPEKINLSGMDPDPLHEQKFDYRLQLKTPYDNGFSYVSVYTYHVKDPEGYYCKWENDTESFVRIKNADAGYPDGTVDFDDLTADPKDANGNPVYDDQGHVVHGDQFFASFESGVNGSMSGIPAYYTVEVRDLIPGTEYRLVERPTETPDGFKFYQYENDENVTHTDPYDPWEGIDGTISSTPDDPSEVFVRNYKGYGLRLEKVWEDATSIQSRDPAFFAVYKVTGTPETYTDADGNVRVRYSDHMDLVPGSVQRMVYTEDQKKQQLYWWYLDLPFADTDITNYAVFEVEPSANFQIDADGSVSGYNDSDVHPIDRGGTVGLYGTLNGQDSSKLISYNVTYADPQKIGNNVLKCKATNEPAELPPVRIVKEDWNGNALSGAAFTLKYGNDFASSLFDPEIKTSGADGLVARVYLQENVAYKLTELRAPQRYVGLEEPLMLTLVKVENDDWQLNVTPEIPSGYPLYYTVTTDQNGVITLTVKNRPYELVVVKVDSESQAKVAGAAFSLYKQVKYTQSDGTVIYNWDENNPVFENHRTAADGVIAGINKNLPAGTYQLRETSAPDGYQVRTEHINFTIDDLGRITWAGSPLAPTIDSTTGTAVYAVEIPNTPQPLKLKKVDINNVSLKGAKFKLETLNEHDSWVVVKDKNNTTVYDNVDMTSVSEFDFSDLPAGRYRLEETLSPAGYIILTKYVYFEIETNRTVQLTKEDGSAGNDNSQASISLNEGVYTITVENTPGAALPSTGGPGTRLFCLLGIMLTGIAGVGLVMKRRKFQI